MVTYITNAISRYNHKAGYIDAILDNLVSLGRAVNGLVNFKEDKPVVCILYDLEGNPYLLYNSKYTREVNTELRRLHVKSLDSRLSRDLNLLIEEMDRAEIHKKFNKKFYRRLSNPIELPFSLN